MMRKKDDIIQQLFWFHTMQRKPMNITPIYQSWLNGYIDGLEWALGKGSVTRCEQMIKDIKQWGELSSHHEDDEIIKWKGKMLKKLKEWESEYE